MLLQQVLRRQSEHIGLIRLTNFLVLATQICELFCASLGGEMPILRTMNDQQRRAVIRALWTEHSAPSRTEPDVATFHGWLTTHRPDLLPKKRRKGDDPCQYLKADLLGLYTTAPPE
jgi:hypothetical protein